MVEVLGLCVCCPNQTLLLYISCSAAKILQLFQALGFDYFFKLCNIISYPKEIKFQTKNQNTNNELQIFNFEVGEREGCTTHQIEAASPFVDNLFVNFWGWQLRVHETCRLVEAATQQSN